MEYYDANLNGKMKKIVTGLVVALLIIFAVVLFFNVYVQYIEIKELGAKFLKVFWTNLTARSTAQAISFIVCFIMFYVSTCIILRSMKKVESPMLYVFDKRGSRILICILLSLIASSFISQTVYDRYLMCAYSTPFNLVDPLFGKDIGYFVFERPFFDALVTSLSSVWMVVTVYCLLVYAIIYAVNGLLNIKKITYDKPVVIHNVINVAIVFVIQAITYKFRSEEVLYSSMGEFSGAGFTEINVWFNFYRVAPYLLIVIVALCLAFMAKGKYKGMMISIISWPALFLLVSILAFCVQTLIVSPNKAVKELPYLKYNMDYTRLAYKIDNVTEVEYPANTNMSPQSIAESKNTFYNIRITDFGANLSATNSLQGIRSYYKFIDSDITKYDINGKPTMVFVAPREIDRNTLPESAKSYDNEMFKFTHGFGVVMSPLNKVMEEGQPEFYIKDIPTVSVDGAPKISEPRIYYGEMENTNVIVNSKLSEIDYYEGSEEVPYSYMGNGGVKMDFFNRLVYTVKNGDFKMLFSQSITKDSRLLTNRNVKARAEKAVPFLQFDSDPYMVIDDSGRLKWIIDGYSTSNYYPYSQTYNGINYIRNSVKAVIDAYDGTIDLYVVDKYDPIIQTYMKIYPDIFNKDPLPEDLKAHIVYPEYLFNIQAQMYARYHVSNPSTLYNKSDMWTFAKEKYAGEQRDMVPYYNLMNVSELRGDDNFIIMIPYTLVNKDNMVAWLAASCDADSYGRLIAYHFPKGKNVYGTMQIENRIDSDPAISREMTLWGQGGSNVIRGNMLVIPVEESIIYIEPIYISSNSSTGESIPELKRIIVAYGENIVMENTLEEALKKVFSKPQNPVKPEEEPQQTENPGEQVVQDTTDMTYDQAIDKVINGYDTASKGFADGDWESFGKGMKEIENAIEELKKYRVPAE